MRQKGIPMVEQAEIVSSLTPLNGVYFTIPNLNDYAAKVATLGKSIEYRLGQTSKLVSYVLFYDNGPDIFISMVWTHPEHQGKGYAKGLLRELIHSTQKDIRLEVHKDNPAIHLYETLGFVFTDQSGDICKMCLQKTIAIMQPYVFPYLGYFHLIEASNLFVFCDDVNYITRGWINRNRILINGNDFLFTIPISKASQNKLINETTLAIDDSWRAKFNRTIMAAYQKAPYFPQVAPLITSTFATNYCSVSDLAISSVVNIYRYLGMPFNYTKSSVCSPETKGIDKADRVIAIAKGQGYKRYVNAPGGINLYSKEYFGANGIELGFVKSEPIQYKQFSSAFVSWLSMIDVLMFNEPIAIKSFLRNYRVI
jgi:hypothetical protein